MFDNSVSDAAIGRALGNRSHIGDDDHTETDSKNISGLSSGPLQQRNLEMVTTECKGEEFPHRNYSEENDNHDEHEFDFSPPQSPSFTNWVDKKNYREKLRKLPPAITNAYNNWTSDNENCPSTNNTRISHNDNGDEIVWKIIKGILTGWCLIWILFAIIIVAAELTSPKASNRNSNKNIVLTVSEEDEQSFLTISEKVVHKCSYSNLDTETGREECQSLCHQHMCCFNEDNFGCSDKPEKMCAAYAGCEALVVSEDDAIIYDASGVDVFGIGVSDPLASNSSDNINDGDEQSQSENIPYATTELQLISEVITTVCSADNLGTKHGLNECVSLCNDGMCCFDRDQIEMLNPNMELILQLEGITSDKLDTSTMGTCFDEGKEKKQFCQVHASCKNLLLLGSHYSMADNLNAGGVDDSASAGKYIVFGTLFAMIIALTFYLLVFQRVDPPLIGVSRVRKEMVSASREGNSTRDEMIEFV